MIEVIREAVSEVGLPAFSKSAGLPYSTVVHWRKSDFVPDCMKTLEKMVVAAEQIERAKTSPRTAKDKREAA